MQYIIKTPVEGYSGKSASLLFCNGKATTDNEKLVKWFRKHGYTVIEPEKPKTTTRKKKGDDTNV